MSFWSGVASTHEHHHHHHHHRVGISLHCASTCSAVVFHSAPCRNRVPGALPQQQQKAEGEPQACPCEHRNESHCPLEADAGARCAPTSTWRRAGRKDEQCFNKLKQKAILKSHQTMQDFSSTALDTLLLKHQAQIPRSRHHKNHAQHCEPRETRTRSRGIQPTRDRAQLRSRPRPWKCELQTFLKDSLRG